MKKIIAEELKIEKKLEALRYKVTIKNPEASENASNNLTKITIQLYNEGKINTSILIENSTGGAERKVN